MSVEASPDCCSWRSRPWTSRGSMRWRISRLQSRPRFSARASASRAMKFSDSIARARAELLRLRALEQDVRWGKIEMEPDKVERLRQYLPAIS